MKTLSICLPAMLCDTATSLWYSLQVITCGALLRNSSSLNGLKKVFKFQIKQNHRVIGDFKTVRPNLILIFKTLTLGGDRGLRRWEIPAAQKNLDVDALLFLVTAGHSETRAGGRVARTYFVLLVLDPLPQMLL